MKAADGPNRDSNNLLAVDGEGSIRHLETDQLVDTLLPGDLVVANDAATLPASLNGRHEPTGTPIEVRLAGFTAWNDFGRFVALFFGQGDYRTVTEERSAPPRLAEGDRVLLGPLTATVESLLDHPRLAVIGFNQPAEVLAGLSRQGRPIQYAHVPEPLQLWDVWTRIAARPFAFESPSAGYALDWHALSQMRERGIEFATLTHAAGISSTGDPELDQLLPFDEPYQISTRTAEAVNATGRRGARVVAVGTTVVRALESATDPTGRVSAGEGVAKGRIHGDTELRVVDTLLTGMHSPGESHYEVLRAFTDDNVLDDALATATSNGYRTHEFGDYMLIDRATAA